MRAHMTAGKKSQKKVAKKQGLKALSRRTLLRQLKPAQSSLELSRLSNDLQVVQGQLAKSEASLKLAGEDLIRAKMYHEEERLAVCLQAETVKDLRGLLATRGEELRIAKVCIGDLNKALTGEQMESSRFRRIIDDQGKRIKLLEECLVDVSSLSDVATVILADMLGVSDMLEMLRAKALEMNFVFNPGPTAQNILLTSSTVSALGLLDAFFQKASEEAKVKK